MYDAIVVGARCAGAPTALLLARKGYRVLVVDRASFPSDKISSHTIGSLGLGHLNRWGLLDRVIATNCPPIRQVLTDFDDRPLVGQAPLIDQLPAAAYCVRRTRLDKLLVDAAVEAGAELREQFTVDQLLLEDERVVGVRGRSQGGADVTERGRIIIGADGMRSLVARTTRAPHYNVHPPRACYYYTYWSGVPIDGLELYRYDRRVAFAIPTNDGCVCLMIGWPHSEFPQVREQYEQRYLEVIERMPALADRIRHASRAGRYIGTADLPNYFRRPYGPGWALVGDAGYHRDPFTAQGISDAFRDAQLLADAIDAGFSGARPLHEALAGYERARNAAVATMFEATCQLANLQPPSTTELAIRAALRGNQPAIDRYCGVIVGTVSYDAFYAPQNLRSITNAAALHSAAA